MRKVLIMHQTITKHDAIGNDIECMYQIISEKYECKCYAENCFNSKLSYVSQSEALEIIQNAENVVIYHHSVNWKLGEKMLEDCRATLVFRYHNITPPEFFAPYNEDYRESCEKGRIQTYRLIADFPRAFWLSDSEYNNTDLTGVSKRMLSVCPPFHKIEEWSRVLPDEETMKKLIYDTRHKVLFVGRVAPNKGHLKSLDILAAYCRNYDTNIKMYIIGKFDEGLAGYNKLIRDKIEKYRLQNNVEFVGEINDAILMAYYLGCDSFLCTSDHEGFCVPIIEAQKFELPIIAKHSCAVPETLGNNQLTLGEDTAKYAAAIRLLETKKSFRDYLRENGRKNFEERYSYQKIKEQFIEIMKDKVGMEL